MHKVPNDRSRPPSKQASQSTRTPDPAQTGVAIAMESPFPFKTGGVPPFVAESNNEEWWRKGDKCQERGRIK